MLRADFLTLTFRPRRGLTHGEILTLRRVLGCVQ